MFQSRNFGFVCECLDEKNIFLFPRKTSSNFPKIKSFLKISMLRALKITVQASPIPHSCQSSREQQGLKGWGAAPYCNYSPELQMMVLVTAASALTHRATESINKRPGIHTTKAPLGICDYFLWPHPLERLGFHWSIGCEIQPRLHEEVEHAPHKANA